MWNYLNTKHGIQTVISYRYYFYLKIFIPISYILSGPQVLKVPYFQITNSWGQLIDFCSMLNICLALDYKTAHFIYNNQTEVFCPTHKGIKFSYFCLECELAIQSLIHPLQWLQKIGSPTFHVVQFIGYLTWA